MARKISAVHKRKTGVGQSEMELAALVQKRLGITVPARTLRQFVADNFQILSILAHEIHAADDAANGVVRLTNS
jgi:hypothetical protein